MNVIDALNSRFASRAFRPDPVEKGTLIKILEAANRAPSWADTQPWAIFVAGGAPLNRLRDGFLTRHEQGLPIQPEYPRPQSWPAALQQRMADNAAHRFTVMGIDRNDEPTKRAITRRNFEFFSAPVVVYLCMDRSLTRWSIFDLGMVGQSIMLAAQELGVDSMPAINLVGYPDLIRAEMSIPDDLMIVMGIALGYGDREHVVNRPRSLRRPLEEVVNFSGI